MPDSNGVSHRDYVIERAKKIDELFQAIENDDNERAAFFKSPQTVADKSGVELSHAEIFGVKAMKNAKLANLRERLALNEVAFFDGNCGCAMFERGGPLSRPIKPGL